uniref:Glycosyltransferase family 92 protein n=1 Tax=Caenorhabditis tropicalis TaxID=1561998 RepID=A0A1I7THJ8_9PELO
MTVSEKDPTEVYVDIGGGRIQMGRLQSSVNYTRAEEENPKFLMNSTTCRVEPWNNVHSDQLPYPELHEYWIKANISRKDYLFHTQPSPLAAYVHPEHITVTLTAENLFGKTVYCRYFDCKRKEIPHVFESKVFPESTVYCGRRIGAKFISVTQGKYDIPEEPVPIQNRITDGPQHYLTVCMATIYGPEPKFIQIVDFIEHHKLHGATFFHIYLRNASAYDRRLLDDYVRTGDIEVIVLNDHHWRDDFMWHMTQINDCHMRSVGFSKWTAILDIDERIEMKGGQRIVEFLDTVTNPDVVNLQFKVQWVLKDVWSPARYQNDNQFLENLVFRRFHNTSRTHPWLQPKTIVRPESIAAMTIHNPDAVYKGLIKIYVGDDIGVIRHYRNLGGGSLLNNNKRIFEVGPYSLTDVDPNMKFQLTEACLHRVKQVYDTVPNTCEQKQIAYDKHQLTHPCMAYKN